MATENPLQELKPIHAYFASLEVGGIKCFKQNQILDLSNKNGGYAKWTVILGDNGTGKTTLLQLLAMVEPSKDLIFKKPQGKHYSPNIMSREESPTYYLSGIHDSFTIQPFFWVNNEKRFGGIFTLKRGETKSSTSVFTHVELDLEIELSGYGASRKMGRGSLSSDIDYNTNSLFNPSSDLVNAEEWLLQTEFAYLKAINKERDVLGQKLERVKMALISILPEIEEIKTRVTVERSKPLVEVKTPYGWVNINDLSFGYQTMIAWTVDFASRMFDAYPNSENPLAEPAVALVDEIDLHLHPKWQRNIMRELSALFQKTQFIVTAHSPLIVQAADENTNIVLLRREADHVVIENDMEIIKGWRVDQILSSDLFENISSRPPEYDKILRERDEIYSKDQLTAKDKERLKEIAKVLDKLPFNADKEIGMLLEEASKYKKSGK